MFFFGNPICQLPSLKQKITTQVSQTDCSKRWVIRKYAKFRADLARTAMDFLVTTEPPKLEPALKQKSRLKIFLLHPNYWIATDNFIISN